MERLTVAKYAEVKRLSVQAVYKQIKNKQLKGRKISGVQYVMVESDDIEQAKQEATKNTERELEQAKEQLKEVQLSIEKEKNEALKLKDMELEQARAELANAQRLLDTERQINARLDAEAARLREQNDKLDDRYARASEEIKQIIGMQLALQERLLESGLSKKDGPQDEKKTTRPWWPFNKKRVGH